MGRKPLQQSRIAKLTTSLPGSPDKLAITRFSGEEAISSLFKFTVEAVSTEQDINFDPAMGKSCTVSLDAHGGRGAVTRRFNGILTDARWLGLKDGFYSYQIELRPALWLLTKKSDCRIFQNKSASDIVMEMLSENGIVFVPKLTGIYEKIDYCVQYRETDFDFISRIMEEEGMYYYFEHKDGVHEMILADSRSAHTPCPNAATLRFLPRGESSKRKEQHFTEWTKERRFRTGKIALWDFNYLKPNTEIQGKAAAGKSSLEKQREYYDYPGRFLESAVGERFAKFRNEAELAKDNRRFASGEAPSMVPGGLVTLQEHTNGAENQQYLVVSVRHSFASETYRSGAIGSGAERAYAGHCELQPHSVQYREPQKTQRPLVYGPQTAKVVGPAGEEIFTDKHGRIKVQFHWDRVGQKNENSSCWIRIRQSWSGKGWGEIYIPRIGMEVIVEFLEGDPDRPIVTGTVYNGVNNTPYPLPDKKNLGGIMSQTTKGGSTSNYNEFVFDDTKGAELIRIHGELDQLGKIKRDDTWEFGRDQKIDVLQDQTVTVTRDHKRHVKRDQKTEIGNTQETKVGTSQKVKAGTSYEYEAGTTIKIKAGITMKLEAGGSTIELGPSGITLKGVMILLN